MGLDLVIGLRTRPDDEAVERDDGEYIVLGTYWHQPPTDYIDVEQDRYRNDPLQPREWRLRLGPIGGEDPSVIGR